MQPGQYKPSYKLTLNLLTKGIQLISIEKYRFFLLTFPITFLKLPFMDYKRKNTMKNSLGNWWWLNSHPEASPPR